MSWTLAPAARAVLNQANIRAPNRSKLSDGTIGDAAHSARRSFHNPDSRGIVLGVDLTHDPAAGIDAHAMVRAAVARRDPRVWEAISNGEIWTALRSADGWRTYGGTNQHRKHAHISIARTHENDISPWWTTENPTPDEDDDMSPELLDTLKNIRDNINTIARAQGAADRKLQGTIDAANDHVIRQRLDNVEAKLDQILARVSS